MAKRKEQALQAALVSEDPEIPRPRLKKLIVKNYRCIGKKPVVIELDEIVVLVGANNAGKSSILKAYELVMSQGSKQGDLSLDDFPNCKIDPENLPEIEVQTIVYDSTPGKQWIEEVEDEKVVRERWIWSGPGKPKREGWNVENSDWSDKVPWGAPNVANTRRPEPHRVDAFDPPTEQAEAIKKLLVQALNEKVKTFTAQNDDEENDFQKLLKSVKEIQKKILGEAQEHIDFVNNELTGIIEKVFPGYKVDFDAKPEDNLEKAINFFKAGPELLLGHRDGHLSSVEKQGSGARRTLLWAALKFISENNQKVKEDGTPIRPHLLLIDEPELCLHPSAIRDACKVLYDLPTQGNWQVMVTTHSPIFIDFSRDNTTVVRVERNNEGDIEGTTVFRPEKVQLDEDDKKNLKLLNLCDPYVAEFFFGGRIVIVEGDTEYTALKHVIAKKPDLYRDVHFIRARGKATIVSLVKVLNHFGSSYSVLHDSDSQIVLNKEGRPRANPAWTINNSILEAVNNRPEGTKVRLLASITNFEHAYFGEEAKLEKPYNALKRITEGKQEFDNVDQLLTALTDHGAECPEYCVEWNSLGELEEKVDKRTRPQADEDLLGVN